MRSLHKIIVSLTFLQALNLATLNIAYATTDACPSEIINSDPRSGDVFASSSINILQKMEFDTENQINRDRNIDIFFVLSFEEPLSFRAVTLLRQTASRSRSPSNLSNVSLINNVYESRITPTLTEYINHHRKSTFTNRLRSIRRNFHVQLQNSNSFDIYNNEDAFTSFFINSFENYWARTIRYQGLSQKISCARFNIFDFVPAQDSIDMINIRIIEVREGLDTAIYSDFTITMED